MTTQEYIEKYDLTFDNSGNCFRICPMCQQRTKISSPCHMKTAALTTCKVCNKKLRKEKKIKCGRLNENQQLQDFEKIPENLIGTKRIFHFKDFFSNADPDIEQEDNDDENKTIVFVIKKVQCQCGWCRIMSLPETWTTFHCFKCKKIINLDSLVHVENKEN